MVLELLLDVLVMLLEVLDLSWMSWTGLVLGTGNINDIHRRMVLGW